MHLPERKEEEGLQSVSNGKSCFICQSQRELRVTSLLNEEEKSHLDDFQTPLSMNRYNTKLVFKVDLAS